MYTLSQLVEKLNQESETLKTLGVRQIGVFGSYRHGTAHSDSDLDVLVKFDQPNFDAYMSLKILLEDLFACKIDLVIEDDLKEELRPHILDEVVYAQAV